MALTGPAKAHGYSDFETVKVPKQDSNSEKRNL